MNSYSWKLNYHCLRFEEMQKKFLKVSKVPCSVNKLRSPGFTGRLNIFNVTPNIFGFKIRKISHITMSHILRPATWSCDRPLGPVTGRLGPATGHLVLQPATLVLRPATWSCDRPPRSCDRPPWSCDRPFGPATGHLVLRPATWSCDRPLGPATGHLVL